jgi:urease accessory protein
VRHIDTRVARRLEPERLVMLHIDHILGSRLDAAFAERIHRLEHRGAVDLVDVPAADLARRRLMITTSGGEQLAITLPREQKLFDGAVLLIDTERAIVVRAATERWLRLEPRSISDAIELGYHAGNLHWRVRFDGESLSVALEGRAEDYLARLGELASNRRVGISVVDGDNGGRRHEPHRHGPHDHMRDSSHRDHGV